MKKLINTKKFLISLSFLALGSLSIIMENTFYEHIDNNGVLQESLFLPLGVFSFLLGVLGIIISIIYFYIKKFKKPNS